MIIEKRNEIAVTAIVSTKTDRKKAVQRVDMYFPDLDLTVHGSEFLSTVIRAEMTIQAVYESYASRGIKLQSKVTNEEAQLMCTKPGMYVLYVQVQFSGGG